MKHTCVQHATTIRVRYADTDKMGIVYNGVYLMYFEIGRTELFRSVGIPYTELESRGIYLPVLEAHVVYKKPALYDDLLTVIASYEPRSSAAIQLDYQICRENDILATGYSRHSFVRATTWQPMRPPLLFTEAISKALQDGHE